MKKINKDYIIKLFPTYTKQIVLTISVFSVLIIIQMMKGGEIEGIEKIKRPNFDEEDVNITLYYQVDNEPVSTLDLYIQAEEANEGEVKAYLEETDKEFKEQFHTLYNHKKLANEDQHESIDSAIDFPTSFKGCEVTYFKEESRQIDRQGWINPQYFDTDIILKYEIRYRTLEKQGELIVFIDKDKVNETYYINYRKYQIEEAVKLLELDRSKNILVLPEDHDIKFYESYFPLDKGKYLGYILLLIFSFSFLSHYEVRHQEELFEKEKRIQLMYFLNNFILMFHSGLTIQKSFYLSIDNRVQTLELNKKITTYFIRWQRMIQQEQEFYEIIEDFQKCFSIIEGRRFCRLIIQNLRQGDHHLTMQLATLSEGMWDQRIRNARKDSEKASSKLVFPMLIIFIVILLITIVPSFMEVNMM